MATNFSYITRPIVKLVSWVTLLVFLFSSFAGAFPLAPQPGGSFACYQLETVPPYILSHQQANRLRASADLLLKDIRRPPFVPTNPHSPRSLTSRIGSQTPAVPQRPEPINLLPGYLNANAAGSLS